MPRTRIKICGIKSPDLALTAVEAGADAIGLVFAGSSPRFIEPARAWEIASFLPPLVTSVGLVVDPEPDRFEQIIEACPCDLFQLHGDESPDLVRRLGGSGLIKAIRFDGTTIGEDLARWNEVEELEALLIDGSAGGAGQTLDWSALAEVAGISDHPIILAGGLTPANVGQAIRSVRPYAVDVSSGVERTRGEKDARLIVEFCDAVREADVQLEG